MPNLDMVVSFEIMGLLINGSGFVYWWWVLRLILLISGVGGFFKSVIV